ncbi:hypothetical protein ACWGJ9_10540 [Curtobacterium citreum]
MTQQQRKGQAGEPTKNPGEFAHARHDDANIGLTLPSGAPSVADRAAARLERAEVLLPTRISVTRDDYYVERVVALPATDEAPEQKVRVKIRHNSYDFQSSATTELMTPNGWERIDSLSGKDVHKRTPSLHRNLDDADRAAQCGELLQEQFATAATLLS